jgi:maltose alpha-D-glucosyltransferase/alpha-amylase
MRPAAAPTLKVDVPLQRAFDAALRAPGFLDAASAFLTNQRWSGIKGRPIERLGALSLMPMFGAPASFRLLKLDVAFSDTATSFLLPLALRPSSRAPEVPRGVVFARIEATDGPGILFDAVFDPHFVEQLARSLAHENRQTGVQLAWVVNHVGWEASTDLGHEHRVAEGEQTNTCIMLGGKAVFKLFRRIAAGKNPDVEIGEFLTRYTEFPYVPRLLATVTLETPTGEPTVAGMLQALVHNVADGWTFTLEKLRSHMDAAIAKSAVPSDAGSYTADAKMLGHVTRGLHEALASRDDIADFAPRPASEQTVRGWSESIVAQIQQTLTDLHDQESAGTLSNGAVASIPRLAEVAPRLADRIETLRERIAGDAGACIRHHGDYHLGQVLRTTDGKFAILDFEGEPTRPLDERRRHHSPLRDVAGMLRSFGYAAGVAVDAIADKAKRQKAQPIADAWELGARRAFLAGYFDWHSGRADLLPHSPEAREALLELFVIEKAFYEVRYELNHRPGWVWVPMRALLSQVES